MVDFTSVGLTVASYAKSGAFWLIAIIILVGGLGFFYLWKQRQNKLQYECLELVSFGNGKVGMNKMKAGKFKSKTAFMGLWDYGNEYVVRTDDGRIIQNARTSHLHDLFGKKGFICVRKTDDFKILLPIAKISIENMLLMFDIAPADYRDASVKLYREAVEETKGTWDKILPYVAIGVIVIFCIISLVINQQMTNNTIDKVGKLLVEGCSNSQNVADAGGNAP